MSDKFVYGPGELLANGWCMECQKITPLKKVLKWATVNVGVCVDCAVPDKPSTSDVDELAF